MALQLMIGSCDKNLRTGDNECDHVDSHGQFQEFVDETLRLGPFTVVVGTNASGKSNIRDAFRFLHGVGRGYTLMEVVGGKWGTGGQREWDPIRGAAMEIARLAHPMSRQIPSTFSFHVGTEPIRQARIVFD